MKLEEYEEFMESVTKSCGSSNYINFLSEISKAVDDSYCDTFDCEKFLDMIKKHYNTDQNILLWNNIAKDDNDFNKPFVIQRQYAKSKLRYI